MNNKIKISHPAAIVATFFGVGKIPKAPGTFGSIAAYPFASLLFTIYLWFVKFQVSRLQLFIISGIVLLVFFFLGMVASNYYVSRTGRSDPQEIVIDEVVGQLLTLFLTLPVAISFSEAGMIKMSINTYIILAFSGPFVFFRIFDIFKPWPVGWCDQKFKGGFGVMIDDIVAGIMAALMFNIILFIANDYKWL